MRQELCFITLPLYHIVDSSSISTIGLSLKYLNLHAHLDDHSSAFTLLFGDVHHSSLAIDGNLSINLLLYEKNQEVLASCCCVLTFVFDNPLVLQHCWCWFITENLIVFN